MELNAETVKKALDWLDSLVGNSNDSDIALLTYQLLGILYDTCEELTEENERLEADNSRLIKEAVFSPVERAKNTNTVRANAVRAMAELLNAQIDEITTSRIELRAFPFAALLAERMKVIVADTAKKVEEGKV